MAKEHLPIYQIQDFEARSRKDRYFYISSFSAHLQEHLFIRKPHKHDFYIILFVTQGQGTHTIDFKTYDVQPGNVFFLTPGQVHSWELSSDADGLIIFFSQEFYAKEYPHRMPFEFPFFNALLYNPVLRISQAHENTLMPILQLLQQEYRQNGLMRDVALSRYLDILLIELTRIFRPGKAVKGTFAKDLALLQQLERLIDLHYKEQQPVSFYAERLHVTPKHLNDVCRNALNKTTKELIQDRTLLEAQRLLVHADLTSSQIAAELGYFDNTYFFRFFKKHIGCTPEQFRASNK
ncbi:AraC family transcriptional regulator [Pontibacter lucknowensis]|uniref:Transcriptional regulator, AraC family n=1 Tax=Pontibacter lucknowensis TaxID=1077936 RepID=A0A1N6W4P7_9BACT|nr:AraC family transcriptional regulator [Pontibacter lucknowensis]SIQ84935.1 transcriptional regulator, AraC family [Pontibacter lucknowensis]